ncbi:MAG: HAD-IG family 5'-nucleotidase [Deltaproteobacteria bacterium]|nr:HAD-IG family 5'-nucleotidase [Deltaproteobacteria bacterium]
MQLHLPLPELTLAEAGAALPAPSHRIFCNRSLRLDRVQWIGFDMDYTLAVYDQPEMDRLSIAVTVKKLVEQGYPEALLSMPFRTDFAIRGLLVDRKLGNVLKMDRYRYVKRAYHGLRELSLEERRRLYHSRRLRPASKRYHWVDTLYALSEVAVYVAVIDALEVGGQDVDYSQLFADVRAAIDASHQDGSILDTMLADLPRYIRRDDDMPRTLHKLRSSGKRLFLLTNSHAAYTERMMDYLFEHGPSEYPSWRNYFEVIITAAKKPSFFTESAPLMETGEGEGQEAEQIERGKIYAGGHLALLERRLGAGGDRVLYVGDHIYGDVLRAKKESAWRTAMIIQEMDAELMALESCGAQVERMDELDDVRDALYDDLHEHQVRLKEVSRARDVLHAAGQTCTDLDSARVLHRHAIDRLKARLRSADAEYTRLEAEVGRAFHPFWGPVFKSGPEVSLFGNQVEQYACLYTARVSNFDSYSPMHYFRSPRDRMPHEH